MHLARAGNPLVAISNAFAASPEFVATYGPLDNTQFVTLVYQNVFERAPDGPGLAFWVAQLDAGMTRGQMMMAFSESGEYLGLIGNEVYVSLAFTGMLRRAPAPAGFAYWVGNLDAGTPGLTLISAIANSAEYRSQFLP
ncbi:MAG TPA: DUF4214 domain-containing protein [Thermomicrobiales bacterium]|nr:DUF4214 domain-containing protein [Thermomicrobiales bacterium]